MSECCHECHPAPAKPAGQPRARVARLVASALAIAIGAIAAWMGVRAASLVCYAVAIGLAGVEPATRAVRSIRVAALDINVLMLIAAAGAMFLGDWLEAAAVVWLFGIAQWLEARSLSRARDAIRGLLTLAPSQALVRRDGAERLMPVETVTLDDTVIVRPGERIPVDGVVLAGLSPVNQAPVTGESWPVEKSVGDEVFAGTVNGHGALELAVRRLANDSTLAHIARLVEQAQRQRAPIQTFVDRFARGYTPAVVVFAVAIAVVPALVAGGTAAAFATWTYRALALLVVACPCALVISTPVSIVSALTAAAREGVLVKGGAHLERLGSIRCVAFDKTGTLTHGRVQVTDVLGVDGVSTHGVLSVAAALESRSEHPIGRAIVTRAVAAGVAIQPGEEFRALPGLGAEARVAAATAVVGSHRLFEERQLCTDSLHDRIEQVTGGGGMPVLVSHDGAALGVIGLSDEVRATSRAAIARLRHEGIGRVVLLTGDSRINADVVAAAVGLDDVHADLLPADKAALVGSLRTQYGPVAMVGDGINDAPALAAADVGIAMGAIGTDVAIDTADVALMADDLSKLPYAFRLGRATLSNIRTNIAVALVLKLAFVALAATGLATLWMAVLADTGASLLVTANSLRLLRLRATP